MLWQMVNLTEIPAKWTGNGSRLSQPHQNDWYETVKINYGVRPDGTKDFDSNFQVDLKTWTIKHILNSGRINPFRTPG